MRNTLLATLTLCFLFSCSSPRERAEKFVRDTTNQNTRKDISKTEEFKFLDANFKNVDGDIEFGFDITNQITTYKKDWLISDKDENYTCLLQIKAGFSIYQPTKEELSLLGTQYREPDFKLEMTTKLYTLIDSESNHETKCTRFVQLKNNNIQTSNPDSFSYYFEKVSDDIILDVIQEVQLSKI